MDESRKKTNARAYKWDKENTRKVTMKLNRNTDADIIARLEDEPNMMAYLKRLIREDIARRENG